MHGEVHGAGIGGGGRLEADVVLILELVAALAEDVGGCADFDGDWRLQRRSDLVVAVVGGDVASIAIEAVAWMNCTSGSRGAEALAAVGGRTRSGSVT